MANSKYSPEPWHVNGGRIYGALPGGPVARIEPRSFPEIHPQDEANAARIVACINACEGINPKAVPDLLAALESVQVIARAQVDGNKGDMRAALMESIKRARAAIQKARGGAA